MSAADQVYRDSQGNIISYPSNPDQETKIEVRLTRIDQKQEKVESDIYGLRQDIKDIRTEQKADQKEVNEKLAANHLVLSQWLQELRSMRSAVDMYHEEVSANFKCLEEVKLAAHDRRITETENYIKVQKGIRTWGWKAATLALTIWGAVLTFLKFKSH